MERSNLRVFLVCCRLRHTAVAYSHFSLKLDAPSRVAENVFSGRTPLDDWLFLLSIEAQNYQPGPP